MEGLSELEGNCGIRYIFSFQLIDGICLSLCSVIHGTDFGSKRIFFCCGAGVFYIEGANRKAEMAGAFPDIGWYCGSISIEEVFVWVREY